VLGGTGRTGSLVAQKLIERSLNARTASRHGAEVLFDWDDPTTFARALDRVDRSYLVGPVMRVRFAGLDTRSGEGSRPNDDIEKVTGQLPTTFRWLRPADAAVWALRVVQ
jgi:hypothetical protein